MTGRTPISVDQICLSIPKGPATVPAAQACEYSENGGVCSFEALDNFQHDPSPRRRNLAAVSLKHRRLRAYAFDSSYKHRLRLPESDAGLEFPGTAASERYGARECLPEQQLSEHARYYHPKKWLRVQRTLSEA
jgi:hypothetical protein